MKQETFLFENTVNSSKSAEIIFSELWPYLKNSNSFIDLGCGMGAWSKELEKRGIVNFKMFDHPSLDPSQVLIKNKENFIPINLEKELPALSNVDLAICIEVLEHFKLNRALELLDFLTDSSDLILFSAAIPNQKGVGHINEQRHSFWHNEFNKKGFKFFDGFKSKLFKYENEIRFYHIQNLFIYYRESKSNLFDNRDNISSTKFELVSTRILNRAPSFKEVVLEIPKSIIRSFNYRFKKE
jgi:SAM-dependent methyltransferase